MNHEDREDRKAIGVTSAGSWTSSGCHRRGGLRPAFVPEQRRKARIWYNGYVVLTNVRFPALLGYKCRSAKRWPLRWQPELVICHPNLFAVFVVFVV
jgi:hypothetical protein